MTDTAGGSVNSAPNRMAAPLGGAGPWICVAILLILHFVFLMSRYAPAISTPDANGYWAQGSLLAETGQTWFKAESDAQYIGMHWLVTETGEYYSRYPPGLAVLVAVIYKLFGFEASVLINPVLALLTLLATYLLLRRITGPWWGLLGIVVLGVNPTFNQHAVWCFAHMAVACLLAWGVLFLVRWAENGRLWDLFVAGLLLGCIPTVRYPEALFGLGVGVFIIWNLRGREKKWLHLAVALIAAWIPIIPLLIRNHLAFGAFYNTAYALTNEQTGFGWDYFKDHFVAYVRGLHGDGMGLIFPLGVIGLVMMCCLSKWRRLGVLLLTLALPTLLLYMAYYWNRGGRGGGEAAMRFLVPTFICYAVAGVWCLAHFLKESTAVVRYSVVGVLAALHFIWGYSTLSEDAEQLAHRKDVLALVTNALEEKAKDGDVIIANSQIQQHLDFVRRWRLVDPMALRPMPSPNRMMRFGDDEDAPRPMQTEKFKKRAEKYQDLSPEEMEIMMAAEVSEWAGERKVYYVGTSDEFDNLPGGMFGKASMKEVARIDLPEAPPQPESKRGRGGFRGRPRGGPGGFRPGGRMDDRTGRGGRFPGRRRFPGMGGGIMGRGFPGEAKEIVIAEWSPEGDAIGKPPPVSGEGLPLARKVGERVRKLHAIVFGMIDKGDSPDYFWPPTREDRLRRLMRERRFEEVNALLDEALKDFKRGR